MFRPLLAHPQEAPQSATWYFACALCQLAAPRFKFHSTCFELYLLTLRRSSTSGTWYNACVAAPSLKFHSTCFEHHLLILRRCYKSATWYFACALCQLAAPGLNFHSPCFEHYLLILRRFNTSSTLYIASCYVSLLHQD
jgi:hypothetical protein